MKFLYLVWCNLKRKKLRTTLTLLSIVVAFVLFALLAALKLALVGGFELADANRLMVMHRVSFLQLLPQSYLARMASIPGVSAVSHQTWFGGILSGLEEPARHLPGGPGTLSGDDSRNQPAGRSETGVAQNPHRRHHWPLAGRAIRLEDRRPRAAEIAHLAQQRAGAPGSSTSSAFTTAPRRTADTTSFLFRYDYFDEARVRRHRVWSAGIKCGWTIPKRATQVAAAIDAEFANSPAETKAQTEGAMFQGFASATRQHRHNRYGHPRRRFLHHPAGRGQHDGPVGARTDPGTRRAQSDRFLQRTCARRRAGRVLGHHRPRRVGRAWRSAGSW